MNRVNYVSQFTHNSNAEYTYIINHTREGIPTWTHSRCSNAGEVKESPAQSKAWGKSNNYTFHLELIYED